MNPDHFRHLYEYHFAANRRLWEQCVVGLTPEQFRRKVSFSLGSVRHQVVHMMNMDDRWFSALRQVKVPGILNPVYFGAQAKVRKQWDEVEAIMRAYLERLDEAELQRPIDESAAVWQVLFHVLNHGTDHRAQTLATIGMLDLPGFSQDYYLYLIGHFGSP